MKRLAYALLEPFARNGVARPINDETIRLPLRWSRFFPAEYEPAKHRFLRERCREGSTAIDVGAHIGVFTVVMSRAVGECGQVISFEPASGTRRVLERVTEINGCGRVTVRAEAVTDQAGVASFRETGEGSNANRLAPGGTPVRTTMLDEFIEEDISCLKIDAEGAELEILNGGLELLRRGPALALEVHPTLTDGECLWDLLRDNRYVPCSAGRRLSKREFVSAEGPFEVQATTE